MALSQEKIKILFGLKIKQYRLELKISPQDFAKKVGLSVSYLNEIEKGKKYPKSEKIVQIAEALGKSYDQLVSIQIENKLDSVKLLLESNFIEDVPFDFFGIDPSVLFEMLANNPLHFSTFINSISRIGRALNLNMGHFYYAILKSYQEVHFQYFEYLEQLAENSLLENFSEEVSIEKLKKHLSQVHQINISSFDGDKIDGFLDLRSNYNPKKQILSINKRLLPQQTLFILARELGFKLLQAKKRPFTYNYIKINSFEEILNNFKASYFASALILPYNLLFKQLQPIFGEKTFDTAAFEALLLQSATTPETYLQRLVSILSHSFGIKNLVFYKFNGLLKGKKAEMAKDLHLYKRHIPVENTSETYCKRWQAISVLQNLKPGEYKVEQQFATYPEEKRAYWYLTVSYNIGQLSSISIGIEIDLENQSKLSFLALNSTMKSLGTSCERCAIFDCKERATAPTILQKIRSENQFEDLIKKYF
jgi:XRE family transcriptional regulator, fatty acid utilization regulator